MLERFRKEGLDARKLNDSKKLLHVWRWLVDAEINCQSLRYQLEKLRIQQEQELEVNNGKVEKRLKKIIILNRELKIMLLKCGNYLWNEFQHYKKRISFFI